MDRLASRPPVWDPVRDLARGWAPMVATALARAWKCHLTLHIEIPCPLRSLLCLCAPRPGLRNAIVVNPGKWVSYSVGGRAGQALQPHLPWHPRRPCHDPVQVESWASSVVERAIAAWTVRGYGRGQDRRWTPCSSWTPGGGRTPRALFSVPKIDGDAQQTVSRHHK